MALKRILHAVCPCSKYHRTPVYLCVFVSEGERERVKFKVHGHNEDMSERKAEENPTEK